MTVNVQDLFSPSPKVLEQLVRMCVQPHALPFDLKFTTEKCALQNLDQLMASSNGRLNALGCPGSFLHRLRRHMSFPGSSSFFGLPKTEPYFLDPQGCISLGKEYFLYKSDVFAMLQSGISYIPLKQWEAELAVGLLAYCLKSQEAEVDATEVVKLESLDMGEFEKRMNVINQLCLKKKKRSDGFEFYCIDTMSRLFAGAVKASDDRCPQIRNHLEKFFEKFPIESNGVGYRQTCVWIILVVRLIEDYVREMTDRQSSEALIPVRMFAVGGERIILAHELLQRMRVGGLDVSGCEDKIVQMPPLATLSFRQVFELFPKDSLKKINFVVVVARDDVTPIPVGGGRHCFMREGKLVWHEKDDKVDEPNPETLQTEEVKVAEQVVETTARVKKIRAPKKNVMVLPKSEEKESEACQKCYRASMYTRKSNEKLRLEKVETKALRKKVMELELENAKKDEKMAKLEADNKEKDERIRILENMLKAQKEQMEEKTEIIGDLEAAISFAPVTVEANTSSNSSESEDSKPGETTSSQSDEETGKVRDALFTLLEIQATLKTEAPISKVLVMTNKFMAKTKDTEVRRRSKHETILYRQACNTYIKAVEANLAMIRSSQQITADQIPELPPFPTLSQWFQDVYKEVTKWDAPKICEALIEAPEVNPEELVDKECLICLDPMNVESDTQKCECCKRRYHKGCIQDWFQVKRSCPTCNSGLLDDQEFPTLS